MRVRWVTAGLLLLALLAAVTPAHADWWDDLDRGKEVALDDIVLRASRYKDQRVTFFCIYRQRDQVFAPLAAPFQPQNHANLAVWADGTPVWEKKAYTKDYPFLYIKRSHPQHAELLQLEEFTRLEVTGRIKGAIRARPCIEIQSFRQTGQRLGRYVVQSMMAGDRHSELGDQELSYENYRRALTPDLPTTYDLYVRRRLSDSLRRLGRIDEARKIDGGEILGDGAAPEALPRPPGGRLGDPLPGTPGAPAPGGQPGPVSDDLPGERLAPGPVTNDLPGQPTDAPPAFPPAAPAAAPDAPPAQPPAAITSDLPGSPAPAGPPPAITSDLPGSPAPAPAPAPLPIVENVPDEEEEPEPEEAVPPPPPLPDKPPLPPGAPPRHTPRLTGVK